MHSDAQFAGSSSVPAHVEMMGLIGMGNNPMVGATVAVAVAVEEGMNKYYFRYFIRYQAFESDTFFLLCYKINVIQSK